MHLIISLSVVLLLTIGSPFEEIPDGVSRLIEQSSKGDKLTKRAKCRNKRCCEFRDEIKDRKHNNINCKSLSIEDCVLHDDICIWDCEQTKGNGKEKRRGKVKSTFVKFDEGSAYPNDPEISQFESATPLPTPPTIQDMQEMSSFLSYDNECGDVYRTDISEETATAWLLEQDETVSKSANSGAPDYDIDGDDMEGSENRRRLQITSPDGRVQTYATSFPYTTAVKIKYYKGTSSYSCSGTMIGSRHVLTAAHCLYDVDTDQWGSSYQVLVGADSYADTTDSSKWIPWSTATIPTIYTQKASFSSSYDLGVIRLAYSPGSGYMAFGYNTALLPPQSFNTFGYPGDKSYGTLWRQFCKFNYVWLRHFTSTECDIYPGQSGSCEYKYWSSTGKRVIYGVASGYSGSTYTYASRIYSGAYNIFCDFIEQVEPGRCG